MSADTERFSSRFRRDNRAEAGTSRVRNVAGDGNKIESRTSTGVSVNVGRYSRDRDSSSRTESIADRMSKLQLNSKKQQDNENDIPSDKDENANNDDDQQQEETSSTRRNQKKVAVGGAAKKRRDKRHLREKRRSTGVVMLGQTVAGDEEERKVMENTAKNMESGANNDVTATVTSGRTMDEREVLLDKIAKYEILKEEWTEEMAKLKKENELLEKDKQRLLDENSSLLRVVDSLSGRK